MAEPELPRGFRLLRRLGSSPLSEVFLVRDPGGQPRALKLLRASVAGDPRILARWRREAQLLAEIDHPNLVRSFGHLEVDGRPGLLLEYIEGASLRDRLEQGALGWEEAARIGVQVARALERLHRAGAVHRDVKPHNILLDPRRGAVLADLGLVRRREDPTLTRQGAALGSPAYMSPEQARDPSSTGPASDVYSLGATLHHALSGRPPFLGSGVGEVIHRVLHLEPEPLPEEVPEPLARVIATALAKDPERRYGRAADLRADLARVLTGAPPRLMTAHRRRRRRRVALAAAGVLVLAAAAAVFRPAGGPDSAPGPIALGPDPAAVAVGPAGPPMGQGGAEEEVGPGPPLRHRQWVAPFEAGWRDALAAGRLRRALDELQLLAGRELPDRADAAFAAEHEAYLRRAEEEILQRGEEVAIEAEGLLDEIERVFRRELVEDPFLALETFAARVHRAWAEHGLRVADLPLRTGGASPEDRLRQVSARLAREQAHALNERALEAIPARRRQVHELLRAGRLEEAVANWRQVRPELLEWSREGRCETARIEALAALGPEPVYRQPLARLRPRLGAGAAEQDWLLAQIAWCRGETEDALRRMRPLLAERWPPEQDPAFWVREWDRELQLELAAAPAAEAADPAQAAARELAGRWREEVDDARVVVRDGGVELIWEAPTWGGSFSLSLPWDRGRWRLASWELRWLLPPDAAEAPRRLAWLDQVELFQEDLRTPPRLRFGGEERGGLGFLPGVEQVLRYESGLLSLDRIPVGRLEPPRANRLQLRYEARPELPLTQVRIRAEPR
ncbi:MAG: serine/threonine protein kinase [Planctomycetota bacterium]|nr:MAG: serine/threonine protein kinase [Planctomycetota bacterium]